MPASPAPTQGDAYELFEYPGYAYPATHPARLEAIARLFGLSPRPAAQSRVLELGCGDGGNLLSLAQALPGARLMGIDAAAGAIERGARLAQAAGLENVELRCMDLEELPEGRELGGAGSFDYILSHGVYSWIPPSARVALLAGVRRYLAPMGVAYVSYNAYPGSYLRDMARDILGFHVREIEDPQRKLAAAQELMQAIVAIEEPSPYAQVLREHMDRMLRYSTALLFHDDLAEISTPFYFHEFMEHATHHQLAFLSEADLFESQMRDVPDSAGQLMEDLPDDVVVREQYLDFFKNRMFRQTLLCHEEAPSSRALDTRAIERLWISSSARPQRGEPSAQPMEETFATPEGFTVTTSEPLVRAAMNTLADAWPGAVRYPELLDGSVGGLGGEVSVEAAGARLLDVLLQAYLARIVQLHGCAPTLSPHPGEHPLASPLARAQLAADLPAVSSLLHANVRL
ncbi:MAG TPA: class I SAM-dependent methyltransferase, partial [Solirubrobacteraceae bacterium]|nr:class I SAM-dependent methyltransferase [Solirubrobacteraceae bacterium]